MLLINIIAVMSAISIPWNHAKLIPETEYVNSRQCISYIISAFFNNLDTLSYIDMGIENQEAIKAINFANAVPLIIKTEVNQLNHIDQAYFVAIEKSEHFIKNFHTLTKIDSWNPQARFLIYIKDLFSNLKTIFDVLLKFNIINVLLVNGSYDAELYTYNPFENYGCGIRYDRIIEFGKCSTALERNLYPNKYVTRLKNCIFRVKSFLWPPFTFKPVNNNTPIGIEEFVIKEISILESFKLYSVTSDKEQYSIKSANTSVDSIINSIREGEVDIVFGGMLLNHNRAINAGYVHGHLVGELNYVVKKATAINSWQIFHLVFSVTVWETLFLATVVYIIFFIAAIRPKDAVYVVLKMTAFLFLNNSRIKGNFITKYLFILWILFASIINVYYQSGLVSLMNNPGTKYQISTEDDIVRYNLKPCVGNEFQDYFKAVGYSFGDPNNEACNSVVKSLNSVSYNYDIYALTTDIFYEYNKYFFSDENTGRGTYEFNQPITKLIYAMFTYKGFPLIEKFHIYILRLSENGLIGYHRKNLLLRKLNKIKNVNHKRTVDLEIIWHILICGYTLSIFVFIFELLLFKSRSLLNKLLVFRRR